ncbi:XRE family transcriptional regulator [Verrucosispora sp. WMMD1129]|uniref:XRE family transcriptional regulator n=1 Tax=Verrucosispora sp. WMMD1129 TaxID=3016093 RepID=UPI00249A336F|nr:XRE family transcriptional regulator [Verrucosispora sp. WMMD1129]WFE45977.1 XRE family transcriptional regulator [Verrucosispora sp. WMMD1129]
MPTRVNVAPEMLRWARERARLSIGDLAKGFPMLIQWESGSVKPTMRQLENYAQATYTPIGLFFLPSPPDETLPVPDFRTFRDERNRNPTPNLLDTIYACEQRQEWYREFAESHGYRPVPVVGSMQLATTPQAAADSLRDSLGFDLEIRSEFATWAEALRGLTDHAERQGILVMTSGIVGSNTHRKLDPREFRGFSLADPIAPLIFINGADTKAAQIFTLAHELAHISLGGSAISNQDLARMANDNRTERWCNEVAAELLIPMTSLRLEFAPSRNLTLELQRLARLYKVSTLVVLRRIFDAGFMQERQFNRAFEEELERVLALMNRQSGGGNFYTTLPVRVSRRFARSVVADTLEGGTLYRDAFRLLGFKKTSTFEQLSESLGVA